MSFGQEQPWERSPRNEQPTQPGYQTTAFGSESGGQGDPGGYGSGGAYGSGAPGGYGSGGPYGSGQGGAYGSGQGGAYGSGAPGGYGSGGQGGYGSGGQGAPGDPGGSGGFGQGGWPGYGVPDMPDYGGGRQGGGVGRFLVYAAVAVLAAGAGAGVAVALSSHNSGSSNNISGQQIPQPGSSTGGGANSNGSSGTGNSGTSSGSLNASAIAPKVDPGVVDVTSTLKYNNETAEGTGMVLTAGGLVLTNNHVIDQATSVTATLVDSGRTYTAKVIGYDSTDDVALLQLEGASGLKTVSVGNSSSVKVGQQVLAIGNAQGKGGTPSTADGTITGLDKTITAGDSSNSTLTETLHHMLQTNAGIQEGDSGGPLVDASGSVVGMDTAANTSTSDQFGGTTQTTGFAIPINNALSIAREIADGKSSSTIHIGLAGFMGIQVANISDAASCVSNSGSGFGGGTGGGYTAPVSSGALVCSVFQGTPAAQSGLVSGDVITSVDGQTVTSESALTKVMAALHPGDKLTVSYVDANGSRHTTSFALLEWAR